MIRINKDKRKNPNLKGEEFIDDTFIGYLVLAFTADDNLKAAKLFLSKALIYKNIQGLECEDCSDDNKKYFYDNCKCEFCPECKTNICTCDLNNFKKLKNYIINIAIKYLNKNQLLKFRNKLEFFNDRNQYNSYIRKLEI